MPYKNKEKYKAYQKKYREDNREKLRIMYRNYRLANPEKIAKQQKEWHQNNSERIKETTRIYSIKNAIQIRIRANKWRIENQERANKTKKDWRKKIDYMNSDRYFAYQINSRFRIPINEITIEFIQVYKYYIQLKREVKNG